MKSPGSKRASRIMDRTAGCARSRRGRCVGKPIRPILLSGPAAGEGIRSAFRESRHPEAVATSDTLKSTAIYGKTVDFTHVMRFAAAQSRSQSAIQAHPKCRMPRPIAFASATSTHLQTFVFLTTSAS